MLAAGLHRGLRLAGCVFCRAAGWTRRPQAVHNGGLEGAQFNCGAVMGEKKR